MKLGACARYTSPKIKKTKTRTMANHALCALVPMHSERKPDYALQRCLPETPRARSGFLSVFHCAREPSCALRGNLAYASRTPLCGVQRCAALETWHKPTNQPANQPTTTSINDMDISTLAIKCKGKVPPLGVAEEGILYPVVVCIWKLIQSSCRIHGHLRRHVFVFSMHRSSFDP